MCPICGDILDCIKNAVLIEDPQGHYTCTCFACYDASKDKLKKNTLSIQVCPSPMTTQAKIDRSKAIDLLPEKLSDVKVTWKCIGGNRSESDEFFTDGKILLETQYVTREKKKLLNRKPITKEDKYLGFRNIAWEKIVSIYPVSQNEYLPLYFREFRVINEELPFFDRLLSIYTMGENGEEVGINTHKLRFCDHILSNDHMTGLYAIDPNRAVCIGSMGLIMPVRLPK